MRMLNLFNFSAKNCSKKVYDFLFAYRVPFVTLCYPPVLKFYSPRFIFFPIFWVILPIRLLRRSFFLAPAVSTTTKTNPRIILNIIIIIMYHYHRVSLAFALSLLLCGSIYLLCDATTTKVSSSSSSTTIIKKTKMTSKLYIKMIRYIFDVHYL